MTSILKRVQIFKNCHKHYTLDQTKQKFVQEELKSKLLEITSRFNAPIRYAIAYGSGIFPQNSYSSKDKPMLDFIFGVTHEEHWHSLNLRQNPDHYAPMMRMLGSGAVAKVQRLGGQVYFHPFVNIDGTIIKYGVVTIDPFLKDLTEWNTFYMAGRMQKPVSLSMDNLTQVLVLRDDARIKLANKQNLYNAVRTALLLLPREFSEEDLFLTIAGFSYNGDPRMKYLETQNKVNNIVYPQIPKFRDLYQPIIDDLPMISYMSDGMLHVTLFLHST